MHSRKLVVQEFRRIEETDERVLAIGHGVPDDGASCVVAAE